MRMVTADGICSMSMGTMQGGVFLTAFAVALGASNYEIGLIATFSMLAQLVQVPGLFLVKVFKKRRAIVAVSAAVSRLLWLFIILIPFLFKTHGVTFLLQWLVLSMLIGAVAGPAWNSLLRDVLPMKTMGGIMAKRIMLGTIMALSLNLGGGYFIDWWGSRFPQAPLYAYSILFALGAIFGIIGVYTIARIPEPTMAVQPDEKLLELFSAPVKDKNFRNLMYFSGVWTFAINMAAPFFIIYMLKRIGLSIFMVTILTVISQLANVFCLPMWGKIADKFSNKSVLSVSGPMFLLATLAWAFTTMPEKYFLTIPLLFAIHILSGISTAGVSIASGNIAMKLSPEATSYAYMTVFGIVGAAAGSLAPMIGGTIADFFSVRELSLSFNWSDPTRTISMYALNFKALDFLFLLSFMVGLYAIHRLSSVKEEGEVNEKFVLEQLKEGVTQPFKHMSSVSGMRRMATMPISFFLKKRE